MKHPNRGQKMVINTSTGVKLNPDRVFLKVGDKEFDLVPADGSLVKSKPRTGRPFDNSNKDNGQKETRRPSNSISSNNARREKRRVT